MRGDRRVHDSERRLREYRRYIPDSRPQFWVDGEDVVETVEERPTEVSRVELTEGMPVFVPTDGGPSRSFYDEMMGNMRVASDDDSQSWAPTFDEPSEAIRPLPEALPKKILKLFPGKRVRVRQMERETHFGRVNFNEDMEEWMGKTVTIDTISEEIGTDGQIRSSIIEDGGKWTWTPGMFEEIEEKTKMKYKIIIQKDKKDELVMIAEG